MRKTTVPLSLFLLLATLSACGGIPTIHYYLLEWEPAGSPSPSPSSPDGIVLGVERFSVEPPFDQDRIVYRADPGVPEFGFYAYHRWVAPVSRMLPQMLTQGLRTLPGVASIEPVTAGVEYDAVLDGNLLTLLEIDAADGHVAQVRLTLTLRRPDGEILWRETLEGRAVTRTSRVESVVERMNAALREVITRARAPIASALASVEIPPREP